MHAVQRYVSVGLGVCFLVVVLTPLTGATGLMLWAVFGLFILGVPSVLPDVIEAVRVDSKFKKAFSVLYGLLYVWLIISVLLLALGGAKAFCHSMTNSGLEAAFGCTQAAQGDAAVLDPTKSK